MVELDQRHFHGIVHDVVNPTKRHVHAKKFYLKDGGSSSGASSSRRRHRYRRRFPLFSSSTFHSMIFVVQSLKIICHLLADGTLAVASSALTGRKWNGSLWLFKDRAKAPDVNYCSAGCSTESGTTDIKWIDSRRLVLGCDSGNVDIWCLSGSFQSLENIASLTEHDNSVSSVSVDCIKSKIVSAGWDRRFVII